MERSRKSVVGELMTGVREEENGKERIGGGATQVKKGGR